MENLNLIPRTAAALAVWLVVMPLDAVAQAPDRPQPPPSSVSPPGGSIADTDRDRPYERPPSRDYRLVSGDKLRIEVYKDAQLSQSLQVRPDGKITMPLIGDLEAAGRTSLELRDRITTALKEYMTNPVVTVIVVE
ncbi:MAG: polysaccharide biosynthesis/export family protein, partial [Vicinamibacterales bacterium]